MLDTLTWTNPQTTGTRPCRRRAHTTCVYNNCMYVFGGGDGVQALNDTYMLNLTDMHWTELKTTGIVPISRGYHTSNLIKSQFIVYGGSDGHECFSDVHVLDLGMILRFNDDKRRERKRVIENGGKDIPVTNGIRNCWQLIETTYNSFLFCCLLSRYA
jgi:hypothetical protein